MLRATPESEERDVDELQGDGTVYIDPPPPLSTFVQSQVSSTTLADLDETPPENDTDGDQVDFRSAAKGFDSRLEPLSEEQRLATLIDQSFEVPAISINFKRTGTDYDNVVRQSVMDWSQDGRKRDPRTITKAERQLAVKKRKELERARSKAMLMNFFNPFC